MNEFPDAIKIQIYDTIKTRPVKGIAVLIQIFSTRKNNYYLVPAPSNDNGEIIVSNDWIVNEISKSNNLFFMDYKSLINDSNPFVKIEIMDNEELNRTIKSMIERQSNSKALEDEIYDMKTAKNPLYIPVSKTVYYGENELLDIVIETQGIPIYSSNYDLNRCSDIVKEFLRKENIRCTDEQITSITKDIMNISYSLGGDYSNSVIRSLSKDYFDNRRYTKHINN